MPTSPHLLRLSEVMQNAKSPSRSEPRPENKASLLRHDASPAGYTKVLLSLQRLPNRSMLRLQSPLPSQIEVVCVEAIFRRGHTVANLQVR